tara:strand:+ start:3123 stop:3995 length:873 start_codon:yes stop_codon:yes gene_type:complete
MIVQFYGADVHNKTPIAELDLTRFLNMIKNPKPEMKQIFMELQSCDDPKRKRTLKEKLFFITPSSFSDRRARAYKNIVSFTGLLPLDFDKIDNAPDLKEHLFEEYKSIHACWLSSSGRGVRALVRIPVVNSVDEFKSYFWGLANKDLIGFNGFDIAPQNPVLPLFASHDPDLLIRDYEECETWKIKGKKEDLFPSPYVAPIAKYGTNPPYIVKYVNTVIDRITDNGHPQVRACAFTLGGWVSNGRISHSEAENLIEGKIRMNAYLSKGVEGYVKTAKEMINRGTAKPLKN